MRHLLLATLCLCIPLLFSACNWCLHEYVDEDGKVLYHEDQMSDTSHADLMGVPLQGTTDQFLAQLQQQVGITTVTVNGYETQHIQYLGVDFQLQVVESSEIHSVQNLVLTASPTTKAEARKMYRNLSHLLQKKYHAPKKVLEDFSRTAVELSMNPNRRYFATPEGSEILVFTVKNAYYCSSQSNNAREQDLPIYQVGIIIQDATNMLLANQARKEQECPSDWDHAADGPHMTFLGIPIQGTQAEFMRQLRKSGLVKQVEPESSEFSNLFPGEAKPYDQVEYCGIKFQMNPVVDGTPDSLVTAVFMTARFMGDSLAAAEQLESLNAQLLQQYGQPRVTTNNVGNNTYNFVTAEGRVETHLSSGRSSTTSIINGNISRTDFHYFTINVEVTDAQGYKQTHRY